MTRVAGSLPISAILPCSEPLGLKPQLPGYNTGQKNPQVYVRIYTLLITRPGLHD